MDGKQINPQHPANCAGTIAATVLVLCWDNTSDLSVQLRVVESSSWIVFRYLERRTRSLQSF